MDNKISKKRFIFVFATLFTIIIVLILVLFVAPVKLNKKYTNITKCDNVILFIGDGMGENIVKMHNTYYDKTCSFESLEYSGYVTTASLSRALPTDSAASATAMATGNKTDNKRIGCNREQNFTNISELLITNDKHVGIITTDDLYGATPACFSAHSQDRTFYDTIIKSQIASNIDLFIGAGKEKYDSYQTMLTDKGYTYVNSYSELPHNFSKKLVVSLDEVSITEDSELTFSFKDVVEYAVEYMERNYPNGYFLMIEGAHIDKNITKKDIFKAIEAVKEFDDAIAYVKDYFANDNNTAIIVTADHETGNLNEFNGTKDDISNDLIIDNDHSKQNVKYYINMPSKFRKQIFNKTIDNTEIFYMIKNMLI